VNTVKKKTAIAVLLTALLLSAVVFSIYFSLRQDVLELVLVIEYADGTTDEKRQPALSVFAPMAIQEVSTGKTISALRLEAYTTVSYTGDAVSWSFSGQSKWQLQEGTAIILTFTRDLVGSGTTAPPVNQAFVLSSATLSASDLEGLRSGWTSGMTYLIKFSVEQGAKFTINYQGGDSLYKTLDTTAYGSFQFKYISSKTFTAFSVAWQMTPYY